MDLSRLPKRDELDKSLAKKSHLEFMKYTWQKANTPFLVGFHTEKICTAIDNAMERFRRGESTYLTIRVPHRHGKKSDDMTKVMTPDGFKNHGDLKPGDTVYGRYGQKVKVLAELNHSTEPDTDHLVKFIDGEEVLVHAQHEWVVYDRNKHREVLLETQDMVELGVTSKDGKKERSRFSVDSEIRGGIETKHIPLELHPYFLGIWLGDGTTNSPRITHDKNDIEDIEYLKELGYIPTSTHIHKTTGVYSYNYWGETYQQLKHIGVIGDKHIPHDYLIASREQRLQLLAGLIDSDGCVDKKDGRIRYTSVNKELINQIQTLASSLGFRSRTSTQEACTSSSGITGRNDVWTLSIYPNSTVPTKLPRKKITKTYKGKRRTITSIEIVEPRKGKCITVEGGIYLVGEKLVPTHNSDILSRFLPPHFLGEFPECEIIETAYNTKLAQKFSKDAKQILQSPQFQRLYPDCKIHRDISNNEEWALDNGIGRTLWVGLDGGMTGNGAHLALVDDPFKNRAEAESPTQREKVWDAFTNALLTRLAPVHIVIVLATPWHEDDLFGRIDRRMKDDPNFFEFKDYTFPARAKDYTGKSQYTGDYLFEERFPKSWYTGQYAQLGPYASSGLLDCSPAPRDGSLLGTIEGTNWHFVDGKPEGYGRSARAWDLASSSPKTSEDPDWTVGVKGAVKVETVKVFDPGSGQQDTMKQVSVYIEDIVRLREEAVKRDNKMIFTAAADGTSCINLIETFGAQKDTMTRLKSILGGMRIVKGVRLKGDKMEKVSSHLEIPLSFGNVYVDRKIPIQTVRDFFNVLAGFPSAAHDDDCDALTILVAELSSASYNAWWMEKGK